MTGSIPPITVAVGETHSVNLGERFREPDGDPLAYQASSPAPGMVAVHVSGSALTVSGVAPGTVTVTVVATASLPTRWPAGALSRRRQGST